jgi:HSP20 family protein
MCRADKEQAAMRTQDLTLFDNPINVLRRFTSDMERLFDSFATRRPLNADARLLPEPHWIPSVDIVEKNGVLAIRADLPGVTRKDVTVEVTEDLLTIKGERKSDVEDRHDGIYRQERTFGSFFRAFPLPDPVKPEEVRATFVNGVLEVTMPLPVAAKVTKPRRIDVVEPVADKAKSAA